MDGLLGRAVGGLDFTVGGIGAAVGGISFADRDFFNFVQT